MDRKLTDEELKQQDFVDEAIWDIIIGLCPPEIPLPKWDIDKIGRVRDVLKTIIVDECKWLTEQEFYPFVEID